MTTRNVPIARALFLGKHRGTRPVLNVSGLERLADEVLGLLFPIRRGTVCRSVADVVKVLGSIERQLRRLPVSPEGNLGGKPQMLGLAGARRFVESLPRLEQCLAQDASFIFESDPAAESLEEVLISYPGFLAIAIYRLAHSLANLNVALAPRVLSEYAHRVTGIDIHPRATIGCPFAIDHGTGIVIGETTVIGSGVRLFQGVTLGAVRVKRALRTTRRHPILEDGVTVYANATILGGKTIVGRGAIIGGNVCVTESVPPAAKVLGTPKLETSVYVKTLGCKVNTFDSDALVRAFRDRGATVLPRPEEASVFVLNTCSVTAEAEREARYLLRRHKRDHPDSLTVVTGCYAQTDGRGIAALGTADLVVPNADKVSLVDQVWRRIRGVDGAAQVDESHLVSQNKQSQFKSALTYFAQPDSERSRFVLKVQDGCNNFCTYCIIPYARGASRSVPMGQIVAALEKMNEPAEVVLTGIHIGDYGEDFSPSCSIVDLLARCLEVTTATRFRISSLEPMEAHEGLLDFMAAAPERFCDHFHLPLQSGSDRILKAMRRGYDRRSYAETVQRIRRRFPNVALGADVIVGFPGETAEDFAETEAFVREVNLSYLHVFPYSRRSNTAASRMPGHLPADVVRERSARLRAVSGQLKRDYEQAQIGTWVDVVWEQGSDEDGRCRGRTQNYLEVVGRRPAQARQRERVKVLGRATGGALLVGSACL